MKPIIIIIILMSASTMIRGAHVDRILTYDDIVVAPLSYNEKEINVEGCLRRTEMGALRLGKCDVAGEFDESHGFIDVVNEGSNYDKVSDYGRICVIGKFLAYSRDFVGTGYLTSSVGLLEAHEFGALNENERTSCDSIPKPE